MFKSKILLDSMGSHNGDEYRITTCELTYPRFIHSEFMTHRMFSRNAASSRAIPVGKMIERIRSDPVIPIHWGANQKGMQARKELEKKAASECCGVWMWAMEDAIDSALTLIGKGLHKQIANRLLEPWMWITVICTGNQKAYENFFKLRCHPDAEPHMQRIAYMLRDEYDKSSPNLLKPGDWHLPLTGFDGDEELSKIDKIKCSVARCARVSYLTHDGKRDTEADLNLFRRLRESGHWSPFEHQAVLSPYSEPGLGGNLGSRWIQYRKRFVEEFCTKAPRD